MTATTGFCRYLSAALLITLFTALQSATKTEAHMSMLWPPSRGSVFDHDQFNGKVHCFIGFEKERTFPCNGYDNPGPVTRMKAGDEIDVRFWGPALPTSNRDKLPDLPSGRGRELNQARHGGGTCQFSLSYDGGKTFHLIGKYTRSCPDFYYRWPVKIPANAPSCTEKGQCLFVWSWTAHFIDQYYQNCADVYIEGAQGPGASLPSKGIQVVDVEAKGYKKGFTAPGDAAGDHMGRGPISQEILTNLKGWR
ncbi:hypothetical protein BGZ83_010804 [Gryganskiella cystojenkinii]|nr:hypothetical protein BGZ83_010804 [Gryganskiella cystojenkinii]